MTHFTVIWWPPARDDLALLWMDSGIRNSITVAADTIDRMHAVNPNAKGMEVHEGLRRLTVEPLVVQFSTDEQTEEVTVYSVRLTIK